MKIIKQILLALLFIAILLPVGYIATFMLICPIINNNKASSIEKELSKITLPPDTEIIETSSYVGNTSGTGNHVEILAGILIRTKLKEEEIFKYFNDYEIVFSVPAEEGQYTEQCYYLKFSYLNKNSDKTGCYIIANYYEPITQCDIRGY